MRNPTVANLLNEGKHPYDENNPPLSTVPRRLTYRDVGRSSHKCKSDSDASVTGCDTALPPVLRPPNPASLHFMAYEHEYEESDENPFEFDMTLG